jgi:hypothetical protein
MCVLCCNLELWITEDEVWSIYSIAKIFTTPSSGCGKYFCRSHASSYMVKLNAIIWVQTDIQNFRQFWVIYKLILHIHSENKLTYWKMRNASTSQRYFIEERIHYWQFCFHISNTNHSNHSIQTTLMHFSLPNTDRQQNMQIHVIYA